MSDEKIEFEPGIYNISNDEYHGSAGYSRSALWTYNDLPLKFWARYLDPEREQEKDTKALAIGEAFHTLVQEPHLFCERIAVRPEMDRRTKAGKVMYSEFIEQLAGRREITFEEYDKVVLMARQVRKQPFAVDILDNPNTVFEQSIFWVDEDTGLTLKARPDILNGTVCADLKSSKDASPRAFQGSCMSYGYMMQAGMMRLALESIGRKLDAFFFICVEKEPPYATAFYVLDDEAIDFGVQQAKEVAKQLKKSLDENNWPDYGARTLSIPQYAKKGN